MKKILLSLISLVGLCGCVETVPVYIHRPVYIDRPVSRSKPRPAPVKSDRAEDFRAIEKPSSYSPE